MIILKLLNGGFDKNNYDKNLCELSVVLVLIDGNLYFLIRRKIVLNLFVEIGENTVLFSLDKHKKECGNQ